MKKSVTVGYQYFCKLKHLAEDKLKIRDDFVYSPTTGQPTVPMKSDPWQRRAATRRTPQRLGEMEVWALEGHSARHILDEFLFLKSDDEILRQRFLDLVQWQGEDRRKVFRELYKQQRTRAGILRRRIPSGSSSS